MRLYRPALAGIALGALLPVTAAQAATGVAAAGSATSSATLVQLSIGSLLDVVDATDVELGTIRATAGNISTAAPSVSFVPVILNGTESDAVTVTPDNSPMTVGGVTFADLGLVSITSPTATLKASDGAARSSSITATLGEAGILGMPIALDGSVDAGSLADTSHAHAGKTLKITNISLPNLADLLAALGIDITKLPVDTLNALVSELNLVVSDATQAALDAANVAVDDAAAALAAGQTAVTDAETVLTNATEALDAELGDATIPPLTLPEGTEVPLDHTDWDTLDDAVKTVIIAANTGLGMAAANYDAAKAALATVEGTIAGLQETLDDALAALAGLVEGVLAGVPLVSVGAAEIGTKAAVGKAKEADVTGTISDVNVLGTDVLEAVTGDSALDLADLADDVANEINGVLGTVTDTLSSVLSEVTGATGLVVPAPEIELLVKETSTGVDGAYGTASAAVTALSISLGSATVPAVYALEGAPELPGVAAVTGGFQTAPLAMKVGTLTEAAKFRPAVAAPGAKPQEPGTTPTHPATGGPAGLAIVAVIGAALAVGVRRRLRTGTES